MKMKKETVQEIVKMLVDKKEIIQNHEEWLKENAKYNNLETRLAFDCWRLLPIQFRFETRRTQGLKDDHIETGMRRALKEIGIV